MTRDRSPAANSVVVVLLSFFALVFVMPILLVLMNSFKSKLFVVNTPFAFPNIESFVGFTNYTQGIIATGFFSAFAGPSLSPYLPWSSSSSFPL